MFAVGHKSLKPGGTKKFGWYNGEIFCGYLFIAPLAIGTMIFSIGPILYSFIMSFTRWDSLTPPVFIGIDNYTQIFADPQFGREFINTLYYTAGTVPVSLILSIILAAALNSKIPLKTMYRTVYFLPSVTMPTAIAMVWQWLFNSKLGLVNQFLKLFSIKGPIWLGDPSYIMPAVIIITIWCSVGYNIVILLAGFQGIPKSYYEAAEMDGATFTAKFLKITLPLLSPTIFFLLTMSLINAFKSFDIIYVFARVGNVNDGGSGPVLEAIRTMVYGIYEKGFSFYKMGYASAESIVLFAIIMLITLIQFYLQKKWVYYE